MLELTREQGMGMGLWMEEGRFYQPQVTGVRAYNYIKIKDGWNFPPVLKIVAHTAQAA